MKKKFLTVLLSVAAALCLCFGLAACGKNDADPSGEDDVWTVERLYAEAQSRGFEGSLDDLIALFKGEDGKSAYDIWLENGHSGSESDFLEWLCGESAYDIWKDNGHSGSEQDFLEWLRGESAAEEGTRGLHYRLNPDREGYTLQDIGFAEETDIVIPDLHNGLPVTAIVGVTTTSSLSSDVQVVGFVNVNWIKSVTIGNNVTSIGAGAFYHCTGLESVTIGRSVTSIGESAFNECTGLTSIVIPDGVTSIGDGAFGSCSGLESITVSAQNPNYSSQGGILYNKEKTELIHVPQAIKGAVTIPDGVTSIGDRAFLNCNGLESIEISDSVTSIGGSAFYGCGGLESVTFGNESRLETIGRFAFYECMKLTSFVISASVTFIGSNAFGVCIQLKSVIFKNPYGWSSYGAGVTEFSSDELQNPETAASLIVNRNMYDWQIHN